MNRHPLVSVVMPAYNAAPYIRAAIESVFDQTYANLELIVVDDGSTDETEKIVSHFLPRLRYVRQPNQRQAAARNTGWRLGRGELVAFLDADDLWLPDKLARQVEVFGIRAGLGLVGCSYQEIDQHGNFVRVVYGDLEGMTAGDVLLGRGGPGGGSAALVPRRVLEEIGGFDVALPPCEDTDLLWRIANKHPVASCPEVLMSYRVHAGNSHKNVRRMDRAWHRLYRKALRDPSIRTLGPVFGARCYGRLHYMMAAEYLQAGQFSASWVNGLTGLMLWPPLGWKVGEKILSKIGRAGKRVAP